MEIGEKKYKKYYEVTKKTINEGKPDEEKITIQPFVLSLLENKIINNKNFNTYIFPHIGDNPKNIISNIKCNINILLFITNFLNISGYELDNVYSYTKQIINQEINRLSSLTTPYIETPLTKIIKSGLKFNFIFVRHGISCTNLLEDYKYAHSSEMKDDTRNENFKKRKLEKRNMYDPELAIQGIERSDRISSKFEEFVKNIFKNKKYIIGASWLIRTQETAYHMLSKRTGKKINIIPHIGETSLSVSNTALSKEEQLKILKREESKINESAFENDWRDKQTILNKSNHKYFFKWINDNTDKLADARDEDNIYRFVIFTHSAWIYEVFDDIDKKRKSRPQSTFWPDNNSIFYTTIDENYNDMLLNDTKIKCNFESSEIDAKPIELPTPGEEIVNTYYYKNLEELEPYMYKCPDNCRTTFCS